MWGVSGQTHTEEAPKRRMPADARREVILEAALDAFAHRGLDGVSLGEVADRAGISKALIYEHFDSKKDLHDAVLQASHDQLVARVLTSIGDAESPEDRLRLGIDAFLSFVEEHRTAWRIVHRNVADPEVAPTLRRVQDEARDIVASLVAEHAPEESPVEGVPTEIAAELFAQQLVGAGQALANWWDDNRSTPREVMLQAHMEFAWLGLERIVAGERWTG
jgi:AcrR family transcriptional regulator